MKNDIITFIKKAILLIIPICLLLVFVEYKLKQIPNSYNRKRAYLEDQLDSINVLVLGSSQSLHDINPEYFSCQGFNLSDVLQSLFYDTNLTLKYIDRMKKLKCVIVSISYFSFWSQMHDGIEGWRDYFYAHFWGVRYPELKWYDAKTISLIMLYTPQSTLEYAEHFFKIDLSNKLNRNGWLKIDTIPNNPNINEISGKERVEFHDKNRLAFRFNEIYSELEYFVQECKKRQIDVVFITTPVLPTYYKYTNPEINKKNSDAIQKLCKEYNCQYYDYFRDDRFTNRDFYNNDHMNFIGAEKFSKILNDDIISKIDCNQLFEK